MKSEDRWHCTNSACGCEMLVETSGKEGGKNPLCSCGAAMKKKYVSPVLSYLDFLQPEETLDLVARKE
jgi:hypothetical protein